MFCPYCDAVLLEDEICSNVKVVLIVVLAMKMKRMKKMMI